MKLSDGIIDCPLSGICKIDDNKIAKCFGFSTIHRMGINHEYWLENNRAKVKINISKEQALELIDKLNLIEIKNKIFVHARTYMTEKRLNRYYGTK